MGSNANQTYTDAAESGFWTKKDRPPVIGDALGRFPSLALIDAQPGQLILDAGCGAGYMSRRMALMGANIVGVEINSEMLEAARKINAEDPMRIFYTQGDITETDFGSSMFDTVVAVAVLFHLSRNEVQSFFRAAYRALKPEGRLVISYTSKKLMDLASGRDIGWVAYSDPKETDGTSVLRTEHYTNSVGQRFTADVWGHETLDLEKMIWHAGFGHTFAYERVVIPHHLEAVNASGESGFVAFEQIVATKK